ncbi:MAG: hypothetical protein ACLQU3_28060 [Limisphaerales bacterium]
MTVERAGERWSSCSPRQVEVGTSVAAPEPEDAPPGLERRSGAAVRYDRFWAA